MARLPASRNAPKFFAPIEVAFLLTRCHSAHERKARSQGHTLIAGVDEVGRGCLFGPVVAAAVILPEKHGIRGLHDSKQLDACTRQALDEKIRAKAIAFAIGSATVAEIEKINIYQASRLAMRRAVEALFPSPDYLLVDALKLDLPVGQKAIIKGDAQCQSIAAASIVAKVHRDALMAEFDHQYPGYDLLHNKGYGTPAHREALHRLGVTPLHRRTFLPVNQMSLFEGTAL